MPINTKDVSGRQYNGMSCGHDVLYCISAAHDYKVVFNAKAIAKRI